jgi:iron complex outermembrane recepter protein
MINIKSISALTSLAISSIAISSLIADDELLLDKSLESLLNTNIQTKSQVGTRDTSKDYLQSSSPVDVITLGQIQISGVTKLTDLLNYYISGFTVTRTSLADGIDHIVQYTLRGMKADQILVLVNGKRYHPSSLVSTSQGTSFVDLNSIPLIAINRVEVLRDGAAAQYGSDAIAGVINVILKTNDENSLSIHSGLRKEGDGEQTQFDGYLNIPLNYDGFINLSISANNQNSTNRAGLDRRLSTPAVTMHYGIPDSQNIGAVFNSEIVSTSNNIFYSNLIFNYHESEASTFYRTPDSSRPIYPNGFLPMLKDTILDYSLTLGAKGKLKDGTSWDVSNVYGYNSSDFSLSNSMNYDLDASSPTSFSNGKLATKQNIINIDLKKPIENFVLSGGLEYRFENYAINSGDSASYFATGSQGFPGYQPSNEISENRNSYAMYLDTLYNPIDDFSLNLALRYEKYSDFGDTTNYKLSTKYKLTPKVLLRATTSSGFRAPSMSQNNYSYTSSSLTDDTLSNKGIFQPEHPASESLGARKLNAEESEHYSMGVVFKPNKNSSLMIDPFLVKVNDRILLGEKLRATTAEQQAIFDQYNISSIQYFTNIANLKTHGIDIKYNNLYTFRNNHQLDTTLWFNYSEITVENKSDLSDSTTNDLEKIRPKKYVKLLNVYKMPNTTIGFNINYFDYFYQTKGNDTTKFDYMVTADLNIDYKLAKNLNISMGGFNIFNTIPNKWDRSNKYFGDDGIMPYSQQTPVDYSGAYYYLSLKYRL